MPNWSRRDWRCRLPRRPPRNRAAFDLAATRTYITALLQLRRGKVDPSRLDFHWNFDPVGVDPREDMNSFFAALDAHDVARAFAQAPPAGNGLSQHA